MDGLLAGLVLTVLTAPAAAYGYSDGFSYEFINTAIQAWAYEEEQREEQESPTVYVTTASLNLRPTPSTLGERISLVANGQRVNVIDFRDGEWFRVEHNGQYGYMNSRYLQALPVPGQAGSVELAQWSYVRNILPQNTPITVIDVRTGRDFQIISFSHGNHADVIPATAEDTATLHHVFGYRWAWVTRPILVIVGDRTFAASINGMPHGGTPSSSNNMSGHLCIHFQGSRTHNGSVGHERDHQRSVTEAYNTASGW